MKTIILAVLLGYSAIGYAQQESIPMENYVKACPLVYELAKTVMESRQTGMPISEAIKPIVGVDDDAVQQLNKEIIVSAYKHPVYEGRSEKNKAIEEFANFAALNCLESK